MEVGEDDATPCRRSMQVLSDIEFAVIVRMKQVDGRGRQNPRVCESSA